MNPFLTLEQYLFLGSPLKITSEQNAESELLTLRIGSYAAFFGSKDSHPQNPESLLSGAAFPKALDLL